MADQQKKDSNIIKSNELRVTWGTAVVGLLGLLATTWDKSVEAVLGSAATPGNKLVLIVAVLVTWAIVSSVDMVTRGNVTAKSQPTVVPLPKGLTATWTGKGKDVPDVMVSAARVDPKNGRTEFLVAKPKAEAAWVPSSELEFK